MHRTHPLAHTIRTRIVGLLAITALAVAAVACNSDDSSEPTAADQVCDARDGVEDAVGSVADDLSNANLGAAVVPRLEDVESAIDTLTDAVSELASEEREALEPEIANVQSDIESLSGSRSLDDLESGVESIRAALSDIASSIEDDLDCD